MTDTTTQTLADFLLARIAEDEAVALEAGETKWHDYRRGWVRAVDIDDEWELAETSDREDGAGGRVEASVRRVLAECAAKRRIVEEHAERTWIRVLGDDSSREGLGTCAACAVWDEGDYDGPPAVEWPCPTLRALASVYADHPEFRAEWAS